MSMGVRRLFPREGKISQGAKTYYFAKKTTYKDTTRQKILVLSSIKVEKHTMLVGQRTCGLPCICRFRSKIKTSFGPSKSETESYLQLVLQSEATVQSLSRLYSTSMLVKVKLTSLPLPAENNQVQVIKAG